MMDLRPLYVNEKVMRVQRFPHEISDLFSIGCADSRVDAVWIKQRSREMLRS
jgi:hypothetical protein